MSERFERKALGRRALIRAAAGTAAAAATSNLMRREASAAAQTGQIRTIAGVASLSAWPFTGIPGPALKAGLGPYIALAARLSGTLLVATTQTGARPGHELSLIAVWTGTTGSLTPLAGTGTRGWVTERACTVSAAGPALDFHFVFPAAIATEPSGAILVACVRRPCNGALIRILPTGAVELVVGGGPVPASAGSTAVGAQLADPSAVAVDGNNNIYVAELGAGRVRKIASSGALTTIAGGSGSDPVKDGSTPTSGRLLAPAGLAVDSNGTLYISESRGARVRRLTSTGVIDTIAGTGNPGGVGDGGPAKAAELRGPHGLAIGASGVVYIADQGNHRIRAVAPDGTISTIAGSGQVGYSGDAAAARAAALNAPTSLALSGTSLYIADEGNRVVREVGV